MGRPEAGFTLIEILIVASLVAVLAGMTAPAVTAAIDRYELVSASQHVVGTIRAARLQAVGRNMVLKVRFDFPAAGQFQIVDAADAKIGEIQEFPDGVSFGAFTDVQFTTAGRANAAVNITVTNGDVEEDRTISVSTSGQVRLQ